MVGPSGSGKSTLGLALAGLVPRELPGAWLGSLTVDGTETRAFAPGALASRVGLVFQDASRQIVMERVEDDVAFGLETRAWPRATMLERVPVALETVGLGGTGRHLARTLSGGQQQRLALAGVLAPMPGLLILDEPTADLDPDGAAAFFERLASIRTATVDPRSSSSSTASPRHGRSRTPFSPSTAPVARSPWDRRSGSSPSTDAGCRRPGSGCPAIVPGGRHRRRPAAPAQAPAAAEEPLLHASGLTFGYDRATPVVVDVSLEAGPGERIALVGPNGGGKSTLGRLLVGLLTPGSGLRPTRWSGPSASVRRGPGSLGRLRLPGAGAPVPDADRPR